MVIIIRGPRGTKLMPNKAVKHLPLRSTGQNLSSFFMVLLRKIFP